MADLFDEQTMAEEREKSIKEMKKLGMMVCNWRESFLKQVDNHWSPGDTGESWAFLSRDLTVEVEDVMYPYIQRMKDCGYLTLQETQNFMSQVYIEASVLQVAINKLCDEKQEDYDKIQAEEKANDPETLKKELDDMKSEYQKLIERLEALEK
jgi:hypothetical protein